MPVEHLSYSSITTYLNCARQWRYKYVLRQSQPTSEEQALGTATHRAVQNFLKSGGSVLTGFTEAWPEAAAGVTFKSAPESVFNEGVRLLSNEKVQYGLNALSLRSEADIERRIELNVPGVPVPVIGFIDWIDADGRPCDLKTSARSWTQSRADSELQPTFYLAALNQAGERVNHFRYVTLIKTKEPKLETFNTERNGRDYFWLFKLVQEVWQAIEAGAFPPNPTSWQCAPGGCAFWQECRG